MSGYGHKADFTPGIIPGVQKAGDLLAEHFPKKGRRQTGKHQTRNFQRLHFQTFAFTSHASRRPSPRKFNASKVVTSTPPGKTMSHQ